MSHTITDAGIELLISVLKKNKIKIINYKRNVFRISLNDKLLTIRLYTNLKPKHAGGDGGLLLEWNIPKKVSEDSIALADLKSERVWLFAQKQISEEAQQETKENYHVCMYTDHSITVKKARFDFEFDDFLFEKVINNHQ